MLDYLLIFSLGFLGSFGHCAGMCGPLTTAFALSQTTHTPSRWRQFVFHALLNLGRVLSYLMVGAAIGALGSVLLAGGQMAGVGSSLRRGVAVFTGVLLIWFGLSQVMPGLLPRLPILHPMLQGQLHKRLSAGMMQLSSKLQWWTPLLLGLVWGLIPCGFLYAAQLKAAETGNLWRGGATMLAFGLGTLPTMLGVGVAASALSGDRRSQLFRLGGWITLTIGILTLARTGDAMVDFTGHAALVCLVLALLARPISRLWPAPLRYRRALGVGAFVLSMTHVAHMAEHAWGWNLAAIAFMLPQHQWAIWAGAVALLLIAPAAFTSFDWAQRQLGTVWRSLHLLTVPALVLVALHCILIGSTYLGRLQLSSWNWLATGLLVTLVLAVLLLRVRQTWVFLALEHWYASPITRLRVESERTPVPASDRPSSPNP